METIGISSAEELLKIDPAGHSELLNDIDCDFVRIPCLIELFKGELNGRGHVIKNIVLTDMVYDDGQRLSLFNYLSHACIRDVTFENITLDVKQGDYSPKLAALCAECYKSQLINVSMKFNTLNENQIPFIWEKIESLLENINYKCNGREGTVSEY